MTNNPVFSLVAAENLFPAGDATRAFAWIQENAGNNEFAASLVRYLNRHNGLTVAQWSAAHAASMGKAVRLKRKNKGSNPAPSAVPAEPSAAPLSTEPQPRAKLSPADRAAARKAIRSAPGWDAYSKARSINTADLSGESLYCAADALGVDVAQAIAAGHAAIKTAQQAFGAIGTGDGGAEPATVGQGGMTRADWARVREIAKQEAEDRLKPVIVKTVIVERGGVQRAVTGDLTHPEFDKLARAVTVRDFSGNRLNVMLVGPTGTGKSFACKQLAEIMGLPFYFQSQASEEYALVGYERVNGSMKYTPFVQAFRDGGVCLLDELDRYSPKALTALNAALANGRMTLDNGEVINRHPDFVCVGAANTTGFGATHDFTAAEKLDLSTISRFSVRLDWRVCADTENKIAAAKADDADLARQWLEEIRKVRDICENRLRLPYVADQRAVESGANLLAAGMALEDVRAVTYLAPFDKDQKQAILNLL